jgi:hypothetical protein
MDLAVDDEALDKLRRELSGKEIFPISGVSRQGVDPLLERLWQILQEYKAGQPHSSSRPSLEASHEPIAATPRDA